MVPKKSKPFYFFFKCLWPPAQIPKSDAYRVFILSPWNSEYSSDLLKNRSFYFLPDIRWSMTVCRLKTFLNSGNLTSVIFFSFSFPNIFFSHSFLSFWNLCVSPQDLSSVLPFFPSACLVSLSFFLGISTFWINSWWFWGTARFVKPWYEWSAMSDGTRAHNSCACCFLTAWFSHWQEMILAVIRIPLLNEFTSFLNAINLHLEYFTKICVHTHTGDNFYEIWHSWNFPFIYKTLCFKFFSGIIPEEMNWKKCL